MATGAAFSPTLIGRVSIAPVVSVTDFEVAIPLSEIYAIAPAADQLRLLFRNDEANDLTPGSGSLGYLLKSP